MKQEEKKRAVEDYLLEKIKKSGYPLEIEISALLDNEYLVFNAQYYFDEEMKQGGDIDIYAIPSVNIDVIVDSMPAKKLAPFYLRTEIAVECKKSETHAWIFYTRPLITPVSRIYIHGQYSDSVSQRDTRSLVKSLFFDKLVLHYDEFKEAAIAYDEIKIKDNKNAMARREIFEGINQLVKFICYEIGQLTKSTLIKEKFNILILFPIIVFDGDLYKVALESGEPKLKKDYTHSG